MMFMTRLWMLNVVWANTWGGLGGTAPDGELRGTLAENCSSPPEEEQGLLAIERASRQTSASQNFSPKLYRL